MPVIPNYTALGYANPRPTRGQPRYLTSPVGEAIAGLGQSMAGLGATLSQEAKQQNAEALKQEAFGAQGRFLQFEDNWQKAYTERARNAPPGAANFSDDLVKAFVPKADEFIASIKSPEIRQEYLPRLAGLESRLTDAAGKFQREEHDRYAKEQIDLGQSTLLDRQRQKPDDWKSVEAEGEQHIRNSGLPQNVVDAEVLKWRERRARALYETRAQTDPAAARAGLGVGINAAPVSASVGGVYQGLQARGLSPMHAAVIAGNVQQESGGNPNSLNKGEGAHGIIQWRQDRWTALQNFAAASGRDPNDINAQLDFILFEGSGKERAAFDRFLAADTPQAANAALKGYIRYGDNSEGTRLANAIAIAGGKDMNQGQGPTREAAAQLPAEGQAGEAAPPAPQPVAPEYAALPYEERVKLYDQSIAADRKEFEQQVEDYSAYLRAGNTPQPGYSLPEVQQHLGPVEGQKVYDQIQQDAAFGADVASVKWASPEEIQQVVEERQAPLSSPSEFRENAQNLAGLATVIKQRNAEIAADPAVYVQQAPEVQSAYQTMTTVMNDPTAAPAAQQAAVNRYADAALGMQEHLGVPPEEQRILPKQAASDIARQFVMQPEGGQNAATLMRSLQGQWGKHWPKVFEQLAKDGELPGPALVVGAMDRPDQARAAEQLAEAARAGKKAYEDLLTTDDKTVIGDKLASAMLDFQGTLVNNPGWEKTFATFRDSVELLAMSYVSQGDAPAAAVARAYEDVLGKKYEIVDTYRVPREWGADPISTGADLALQELNGGVRLPTSLFGLDPAETEKQYLSALKAQGFWVTSPDESGLTLYDGTRRAVQRADGSTFSLTWQELNDKAAGRAIEGVTGAAKTQRIIEQGPQLYPGQAAEPVQQQPGTENYPILRNIKPYQR